MHKASYLIAAALLALPAAWSQNAAPAANEIATPAVDSDTTRLRAEVEQLKKTLAALEQRLNEQEQKTGAVAPAPGQSVSKDLQVSVKDLEKRVSKNERDTGLDRVKITGDFRFETHSIFGKIPDHYDGMQLQNLLVKTMFSMNILGRPPASIQEINGTVASHYGDYLYFTNNLTFNQLKQGFGQIPASMQQQLFAMLQPSTLVKSYNGDTNVLYTNRLRLNLDAKVSDNISFTGRLSMYKVFGDSSGVQVFNGQSTSLNVDGTTAGVPNSDMLRVERAYFTWSKIGGSPLYLSIGRRPSTDGPPLNFRHDEPRGGTPSGSLIDYQFDGITIGYHLGERTALRLCYGLGYSSGFGNGNILKLPQDRLKDVHFLGGNIDLWQTDKTLLQLTIARAFDVTDGFTGSVVLPNNPLTGDPVGAPVVMRFTPSANLGNINLVGVNLERKVKMVDLFTSFNFDGLRPNGTTTPFGGLGSDPFEQPVNHNGYMYYIGARYNFGNEEKTKLGFEFNHGSKYWFNFAQAEDDIIAPKTNTRGNVFESYLTHRISSRFILKLDYIRYNYQYSGSGWHIGAPKALDSTPVLGFPTYKEASMLTLGLTARY